MVDLNAQPARDRAKAHRHGDQFFSERRGNLWLLAIGLTVLLAGMVVVLLTTYRQHALWSGLPVVIAMGVWALLLVFHIHRRRRCSPALRLEAEQLRYIGGNPLAPSLQSLRYADIEGIVSKSVSSTLRLRLNNGKYRSIPVGMLSREERNRFLEAVRERLPTVSRKSSGASA
ncbi:hypothetical protein [Carnimonas bestiolae]|uniref:hypothetical protein n=1 Tax=Carnimonas bestiolae TaxID=3402172 RepID=UPI003EDB86F0